MSLFDRLLGRPASTAVEKSFSPVASQSGGWWPIIFEPFAGAWQHNMEVKNTTSLSCSTVFACVTLISSDIAKLRPCLKQQQKDGTWQDANNPAYDPVLRKPNDYQTRNQFWESWMLSKLSRGNTYALKVRDNAGIVRKLYILNPNRVQPLISDSGDVFYSMMTDPLNELNSPANVIVPSSEVIHDRFNCLFHPLVGISPLYACAYAVLENLNIQKNSSNFFGNASRPSGILTAPGTIKKETVEALKAQWETNYTGVNSGKVAVLGDNLKFEAMSMNAVDAQLIEQLKWTSDTICSVFHVPPYKVGMGTLPTYQNIQALNVEYYSQCLQSLIEAAEEVLDDGLGIGWAADPSKTRFGVEFDIMNLLRMDSSAQINTLEKGVAGGIMAPNEARLELDLPPVAGGDTPYLQQQNFSLAALAKRDAQENPFASNAPPPAPTPDPGKTAPAPNATGDNNANKALFMRAALRKELGLPH